MRRKALLSIMTLYHHDTTIFDKMVLPDGPSHNEKVEYAELFTPDREALIAGILTDCAELEILLTDPEQMKQAIRYWSIRNYPIWQKLLDSCLFSYNPIWNVDGDVDTSKSGSTSGQYSKDGGDGGTETTQVAAFDQQSTWSNASKVTTDNTWGEGGTDSGSHEDSEHIRRTGNIGVTMTQDMIQKERDIALFNWYEYIITDFKRHFCIMVY